MINDSSHEKTTPPDVVYHYTSLDALTKIVETRQLWATGIGYLNDSSERTLYQKKAQQRLPELLKSHPDIKTVVDETPRPSSPPWDFDNTLSAFVTSFSCEDNSLPQWRSYTPPGLGVRVGFRVSCLTAARVSYTDLEARYPATIRIPPTLRLGRVQYIDRLAEAVDDESLLEEYRAAVDDFVFRQKQETLIGRFDLFLEKKLGNAGCMFKDDSFRAENEYRLLAENIRFPYAPLYFRSAKATLVPYIKLDIPRSDGVFTDQHWDAIDSIRIGPTPNESLTMPAIASLVFSRGISIREIANSGMPYRDL